MIAYVYNKHTNKKINTVRDCAGIISDKEKFLIISNNDTTVELEKKDIKIVVYGF